MFLSYIFCFVYIERQSNQKKKSAHAYELYTIYKNHTKNWIKKSIQKSYIKLDKNQYKNRTKKVHNSHLYEYFFFASDSLYTHDDDTYYVVLQNPPFPNA